MRLVHRQAEDSLDPPALEKGTLEVARLGIPYTKIAAHNHPMGFWCTAIKTVSRRVGRRNLGQGLKGWFPSGPWGTVLFNYSAKFQLSNTSW